MYESLLSASLLVRLLWIVVPSLLIVIPLVKATLRRDGGDRSNDNLVTAAIRFVGAAFVFIGSFANVTAWQGAGSANTSLKAELSALSALTESLLDYEQDPTLEVARLAVVTYVRTVRDTELASNPDGTSDVQADGLERNQRVKNSSIGGSPAVTRDSAEQAALDIRSAVIAIEEADIVSDRDLARMLAQVDDFQAARRDRLSVAWPLVSPVVVMTLLIISVVTLILVGVYPHGGSRGFKWLQVIASTAVVGSVWFAVMSTQDISVANHMFSAPIEAFLARYG